MAGTHEGGRMSQQDFREEHNPNAPPTAGAEVIAIFAGT
jgi:hypothetical protein